MKSNLSLLLALVGGIVVGMSGVAPHWMHDGYCPKKCVTIISHIFHFVQNYLLSFQHLH